MTALGIDLGTTFGYAFDNGGYGSCTLKKKPKEPIGIRYACFEEWLYAHVDVGVVYYEDVKNHAGVLAAHAYGGYLAILQMYAYKYDVKLVPIGVGTIKKYATGKGNAAKEDMIAAAQALGYDVQDHNAADAIHILRCGLSMTNK